MRFSEAFSETLFRFGLKQNEIAEKSGLTPTQVGSFRKGQNLRSDSLERILAALPQDAREYMLLLVASDAEPGHIQLPEKDRQIPLPKGDDTA